MHSFITPYSSTLSLLAAPKEVDAADEVEPEHIFEVLQRLRESYEFVVLDPQHTFDPITLAALDQSDEILLVLTLDIPAIRSTQRALENESLDPLTSGARKCEAYSGKTAGASRSIWTCSKSRSFWASR